METTRQIDNLNHVRRAVRTLAVGAALLALAACSGTGGGNRAESGAAPNSNGYYKVGNPYQINGVWYYPAIDWNYDEKGIASWYGADFHGKYTANGEVYDMNQMTAAHRTLPMPSIVQVTNLDNGRTVQVRVNDRGPYARDRILDLSRRAAQMLGLEQAGTAHVQVKILQEDSITAQNLAMRNGGADAPTAPKLAAVPVTKVATETLAPPSGVTAVPGPTSAEPTQVAQAPVAMAPIANPPSRGPGKLALVPQAQAASSPPPTLKAMPAGASRVYVQAGAFSKQASAEQLKAQLDQYGQAVVSPVKVNGASLYRVRLGPMKTVEEADSMLNKLAGKGIGGARIAYE